MALENKSRPVTLREGGLSSGSTLLNLACSDHPDVAFFAGGFYLLVGDSSSGKTWTSLTCFAEAKRSSAFKDYRLIFDDVEGGALMDMEYYFGKQVAKSIEQPGRDKRGRQKSSQTVEDFYRNIWDAIKEGKPFIYVLDSQDALGSEKATEKFAANKAASEKGEEGKGSYGDGKAKYHSENLRHVLQGLRKTKSILIMISQTRDNLGYGFEKKTRSGGKSLRFFANLEIWTSVAGKLKKHVRGKERTLGIKCLAEVKKNRVTGKIGKDRAVEIPIYYGLGMDDVGACVDFLVENKHWGKVKSKEEGPRPIEATELMFTGSRSKLIRFVEDEDLQPKLNKVTAAVWQEIEDECAPDRKRRYE